MEVVSSSVSVMSLPQPGHNIRGHQSGNTTCQRDRPADCLGYRRLGFNASGVYDIYPISCCQSVSVWCDMVTSGGGWTVALSRGPQLVPENFARLWDDYKSGFGNPNREYWIGNEVLHHMTMTIPTAVRVDVENFSGKRKFGEWGRFSVANESQQYKLAVENYWDVSTLGDDLKRNNGATFTTLDRDNDDNSGNCAEQRTGGGWWFTSCSDCTPTAVMANTNHYLNSSIWSYWQKDVSGFTSLRWLQLKIRPEDSQGPVRKCSVE
ncbi:techylectin-5B [Procambarus clarkii]|uniref:techylectin-5B n=1 Tax=Procambarus clarkii TaxID=6728 RepID=UPI00374471C8